MIKYIEFGFIIGVAITFCLCYIFHMVAKNRKNKCKEEEYTKVVFNHNHHTLIPIQETDIPNEDEDCYYIPNNVVHCGKAPKEKE